MLVSEHKTSFPGKDSPGRGLIIDAGCCVGCDAFLHMYVLPCCVRLLQLSFCLVACGMRKDAI